MYEVVFHIPNKDLKSLFELEDNEFTNKRAGFQIENETLKIWAKDAVAFKTIMTAISRVIQIYEKTNNLIKNE